MSELPRGWIDERLSEVCELITDGTHHSPSNGAVGEFKYVTAKNIRKHGLDLSNITYVDATTHREIYKRCPVKLGDVLYIKDGATTGLAIVNPLEEEFSMLSSVALLRPADTLLNAHFLRHQLNSRSLRERMTGDMTGSAIRRLTLTTIGRQEVAVPPLAEQKRIVAKLDALNAKSARARTELARIETLVSRYKQAVLSKAFSGELFAPVAATGEPFVDVVRRERERLLAGQRTRNAKGAAPSPDRKPVEISSVPKGWCVLPLEELCDPSRLIQYGILMPGPDVEGGVPYVKVMNIKGGLVDLEKIRRTTSEIHHSYSRSTLKQGDLLLTIRGTVGRVAVTPAELDGGNITQDTVRIAVLNSINPRYIYWYLQSQKVQQYFEANKKGVAVQGINVGDVRPMEVPVPPLEEQHEIVRLIEAAFARMDRLAKEAKRALELVGRLDEAILAKAFRGELVPQDENDEPAEHLLARIRAERAAAPKARRGRAAKA